VDDARADGVRVAYPLFQAGGGGSSPTSALQLTVEVVSFKTAKELNRLWHSRLPRIADPGGTGNAGLHYAAEFDGLWYAAAIWTHPVAYKLPQTEWLELRRLAVAPDAPKNTASRMLGVMVRLIRKERPELTRLISYQDTEVHTGTIYKAAGWTPTVVSQGPDWAKSRPRPKSQSTAEKQRWELVLKTLENKDDLRG